MADFNLFNIDTDPPTQYTQYDVPQAVNVTQTFNGDTTTIVNNINGASGPNIHLNGASIGVTFTGGAGGNVNMTISNAALFRTSISAAKSGVNTDITQLNGASQVDVSGEYKVAGVQVVGAQQAAIPDAAGGVTIDTEARAALNTLLAELRTHGLIAL